MLVHSLSMLIRHHDWPFYPLGYELHIPFIGVVSGYDSGL